MRSDIGDHVVGSAGVSWIASHKDMPSFRRTDGEATDSMLILQLLQLPLLLSPLGTSFSFCTFVRLGQKLFNGDDGDRFGRGDEICMLRGLATSAFALTATL